MVALTQEGHNLFAIVDTDSHFSYNHIQPLAQKYDLSFYTLANSKNDIFMTIRGIPNISNFFHEFSRVWGINNSYILLPTVRHSTPRNSENSTVLIGDFLHGRPGLDQLLEIDEISEVYETMGVYGFVALANVQDDERFKASVNKVNDLRHCSLLKSNETIEPIAPSTRITLSGKHYETTNAKEASHVNNPEVNKRYARGCIEIAQSLDQLRDVTLIYAPLRGAKPMVDVVLEAARRMNPKGDVFSPEIIYPITSSFVSFPIDSPYDRRFGHMNNLLTLKRLKEKSPELLKRIAYIDEIISGSMMRTHLRHMVGKDDSHPGILGSLVKNETANIKVCGLADRNGERLRDDIRKTFQVWNKNGLSIEEFPVPELVTEDQRKILGLHYLDYRFGPKSVPMINPEGAYFRERMMFWDDVLKELGSLAE